MDLAQLLTLVGGLIAVHAIIAFALPTSVALPILFFLLVVVAVLVILLVLFRPSEGGGLAGAFGGMGSDNVFGVRAAAMIDKVIAVIATLFLTNAILIGILSAGGEGAATEEDEGTFHQQAPFEGDDPAQIQLRYIVHDNDDESADDDA